MWKLARARISRVSWWLERTCSNPVEHQVVVCILYGLNQLHKMHAVRSKVLEYLARAHVILLLELADRQYGFLPGHLSLQISGKLIGGPLPLRNGTTTATSHKIRVKKWPK